MHPVEALMREWLAGDDPAKRAHAKARIEAGFGEQVVNFVHSAVRHVSHGMPAASEATVRARLDACRSCEKRTGDDADESSWRCGLCGCFLPTKATWGKEHCPAGRWPAEPTGEPK